MSIVNNSTINLGPKDIVKMINVMHSRGSISALVHYNDITKSCVHNITECTMQTQDLISDCGPQQLSITHVFIEEGIMFPSFSIIELIEDTQQK